MLKYALCAVLCLLPVGCSSAAADGTDEMYGQSVAELQTNLSSQQVSQLVQQYYISVRGLNLASWLDNFAKDAVLEDPFGLSTLKGKENIALAYQSAIDSFTVLNMVEQDVFTPDMTNEAAIRWTANLTFKNGLQVDPFNGITTIVYNKKGKIKLLKAFWKPEVLVSAHY